MNPQKRAKALLHAADKALVQALSIALLLFATVGCGSSNGSGSAAGSAAPSQNPAAKDANSSSANPESPDRTVKASHFERTEWRAYIDGTLTTVTDIGWQENDQEYNVYKYKEFTMIESNGAAGYLTRVLDANRMRLVANMDPGQIDEYKSLYQTSGQDFEDAEARIAAEGDSVVRRSWNNQLSAYDIDMEMNALIDKDLSRCVSNPWHKKLLGKRFQQYGNPLISSQYRFYLDRVGDFRTALQVEYGTGKIISIAFSRSGINIFDLLTIPDDPENHVSVVDGGADRMSYSHGAADISSVLLFESSCEDAYSLLQSTAAKESSAVHDRRASEQFDTDFSFSIFNDESEKWEPFDRLSLQKGTKR